MPSNYTMTIAGSPVTVQNGTFDVVNQIGQRSTGTVNVYGPLGVIYKYGTAVQAFDQNGTLIYSGYTSKDKVGKSSRQGYGHLEHQIQLMDNCYRCDKRLFFGSFLNTPAGTIVRALLNQVLIVEGVTATASSIATGATITQATWNGKTVSYCLNWLAQECGYWWNIDIYGVLWFQPYSGIAAPVVLDGTTVNVDSNLWVTFGNDQYVNRQYVKGAYAELAVRTETFHGNGLTQNFTLSYPVSTLVSITLDSVLQTVETKGSTGNQWYYATDDAVIAQDVGGTPIGSGDTLAVTYKGRYPILALAQNAALITAQKAREGVGTGFVESEYSNAHLYTEPAAFQVAGALLAHYGTDMTQLEFDCLASQGVGLLEGQMLTVNLPDFTLVGAQMLISTIEITDSVNESFSMYYHVTAIGSPYDASQWQTYWQTLMNQATDSADLSDVDDASGLAYLLQSDFDLAPTIVGYITKATCPIVPFTIPVSVC